MNFVGEALLYAFAVALFITIVIILGTGTCIILAIIGKWIGIDMFITVTAFIAYWKAWDFLAWIVEKIANRVERKKETKVYPPYCENYKDTYLECAICKLDGKYCSIESGKSSICNNYKMKK